MSLITWTAFLEDVMPKAWNEHLAEKMTPAPLTEVDAYLCFRPNSGGQADRDTLHIKDTTDILKLAEIDEVYAYRIGKAFVRADGKPTQPHAMGPTVYIGTPIGRHELRLLVKHHHEPNHPDYPQVFKDLSHKKMLYLSQYQKILWTMDEGGIDMGVIIRDGDIRLLKPGNSVEPYDWTPKPIVIEK